MKWKLSRGVVSSGLWCGVVAVWSCGGRAALHALRCAALPYWNAVRADNPCTDFE